MWETLPVIEHPWQNSDLLVSAHELYQSHVKWIFFSDQRQVSNADSIVAPDDWNEDGRRCKCFLSIEIQPIDSLVYSDCVSYLFKTN
jgi:hypothetical protein